jgi:hypothetical protein
MTHADLRARALVALACALALPGCALWRSDGEASATGAPATEESRRESEAALAILARMSAHLAAHPVFRMEAEIRYDAVQASGQRIEFGSLRRIAVRRPDRMRSDVEYWDGDRELFTYDGSRIWAASPTRGVYASVDYTGPTGEALQRLQDELGAQAPLAELVDPELVSTLRPTIVSGARVGAVRVDGRLCDQLAFRMHALDFQVFVEQGDTPLPRRLVIDYREEPGRPQFRATLREWDLAPELPDDFFRFMPALGAQRVPFDELAALMLDPFEPAPDPADRGGAP